MHVCVCTCAVQVEVQGIHLFTVLVTVKSRSFSCSIITENYIRGRKPWLKNRMPISVSLVTILNKRHAYICKMLHLRISSIAIVCVDAEHKQESFDLILKF